MEQEKLCIFYKPRPQNNFLRQFGAFDWCKHHQLIDGFHFTFSWKNEKKCPFEFICKHCKYEEQPTISLLSLIIGSTLEEKNEQKRKRNKRRIR